MTALATDGADEAGRATETTVVIGLGCLDRGDDGVGLAVAAGVAAEVAAGRGGPVRVVVHADPTALIELMAGVDVMVIADAVRSGAPLGTVTVLVPTPDGTLPGARTAAGFAGTHGLGLGSALSLAGALGLLPRRTVVVGVEAAGFEPGVPISAKVAEAVPAAVAAVLNELARRGGQEPARRGSRGSADVS